MQMAKKIKSLSDEKVMIGGPEKFIEIKDSNKISIINANLNMNSEAYYFFQKCLNLYDSGLIKELEDIL